MAKCKTCGSEIQFGFVDGAWIPFEPIDTHDDMDRGYLDENGILRADHRDRHSNLPSLSAIRLDERVRAKDAKTQKPEFWKFKFGRKSA